MASLNTNAAAITALRTLQNTNSQLEKTQKNISTGLRIGEAKDNAAYWSISTMLKSDNNTLGTVKDALNLGSSTVDTAYQGLNKAKDVLDEIKKKLVAASQDGVDKKAIQGEITELQKQLKAIASASTFSGENWLSVDSTSSTYSASKSVVSSFNRSSTGSVSIDTIGIDISKFSLTDASTTKEAILDGGKTGNDTNKGGVADMNAVAAGTGTAGKATITSGGTFATPSSSTGAVDMKVTIDGTDYTVSLTTTTGTTSDDMLAALKAASNSGVRADSKVDITYNSTTQKFSFVRKDAGSAKSVELKVTDAKGTGVTAAASQSGTGTAADATGFGTFSAVTLDDDDLIMFKIAVDGGATKTVTIDKATVNAALNRTDGAVGSSANYATVINKALQNAGIANAVAADDGGTKVKLSSVSVGTTAAIQVTGTTASKGLSILTMDASVADKDMLTKYVNLVNAALNKVTSAAATLGAVASRIDMQKTFVDTLMDTIDKGVGGLIDADMSEESTKLQALQVKQQLGVQALSIANQSSQNILSLFRTNS